MTGDWLRGFLPQSLFNIGPWRLMWWQLLAFPVLIVIALAVGRALGAVTRSVLLRITRRTASTWDDRLLARISGGISILWALAIFRALLPWIDLDSKAQAPVLQVLGALVVIATFWMIWRSVDLLIEMTLERSWAVGHKSLLSVGGNFVRIAVVLAGAVTTIASFGYPVTTLLAGLGIGGIAIAFGAQKTVENLFGSLALAADQACRVGDTIKVEDVVGVVERIGARSTQIRTPDRTVVTLPNGKLSDMRIENFAVRDRIRFATTIKLFYNTTESQLATILAGMEQVLREHPKIWPDQVFVRFVGFGESSLDIEVLCWFATSDYDRFRDYRQDALLGFVRAVEKAGASLAFPSPVHIVRRKDSAAGSQGASS